MITLVTGSGGLVGTALKSLDLEGFVYLERKDADLTSPIDTARIFKKYNPTRVVHLAAVVGGVGSNSAHPGSYFRENILINTNVLEISRQIGVQKLISLMSTCVFPDNTQYPLRVETLHDGPPHVSNFGYAYAKRMLEVQSRAYRQSWGCNYILGVPSNIYGPGDNFSLTEGHVLPALIHRAFLAKSAKEDLLVWGTGRPLREFIFSRDVAKVIVKLLDIYEAPRPVIISSGIETSIADAVKLIADLLDFRGDIRFDGSKPDGQYRKPSDVSAFRELIPTFQWTDLRDGLSETIAWLSENYDLARK